MSYRALLAVSLIDGELFSSRPASTLLTLYRLAHHHNWRTGACFPSQTTVANGSGMSLRSVTSGVADLIGMGLIEEVDNVWAPSSNVKAYRLTFIDRVLAEADIDPDTIPEAPAIPAQRKNRQSTQVLREVSANPADITRKVTGKGEKDKRTPRPPTLPRSEIAEAVDAIWAALPTAQIRKRTQSKGDVLAALEAAVNRGHAPGAVVRAMAAYYADPDNTREDFRWAKGAQRVIANDRWLNWKTDGPAQPSDDLGKLPAPAAPGGLMDPDGNPIASLEELNPFQMRIFRTWAEDYAQHGTQFWHMNRGVRGPHPGEPGCRIPEAILLEFGIDPFEGAA